MNNKTYFYRVANGNHRHYDTYPMGPYSFFNPVLWKNYATLPFTSNAYNIFAEFASKEVIEYKKLKIDNYKLSRVPTLPNSWRPGPFEDIDLREKMIGRMGAMTKKGKFHLYGFDSMMQALNWYNNLEELNFLESCGFSMYKFRVSAKNMIVGKRQAVYFPDVNNKNEMVVASVIKLTELHKPVTLPLVDTANAVTT